MSGEDVERIDPTIVLNPMATLPQFVAPQDRKNLIFGTGQVHVGDRHLREVRRRQHLLLLNLKTVSPPSRGSIRRSRRHVSMM